jgi:Tfp pilus assembly protein PilF
MMDRILIVAFVAVIGGIFSACSDLPRVLVLHDPLTSEEHVTLGLAYEVEGRPELAAREFDGALRKKHGYMPALIGLGNLAFDRGALEEAEAYYRQALITTPEDPGVNNNLAMVYLTQQKSWTKPNGWRIWHSHKEVRCGRMYWIRWRTSMFVRGDIVKHKRL